jgi:hypothetical protein
MKYEEIAEKIANNTLITPDRLIMLHSLARATKNLDGAVIEMGTFKGGSALLIANASGKTVHIFDSFQGLPEPQEIDMHNKGDFSEPRKTVEFLFNKYNLNCKIHEGWVPDTFQDCNIEKVAFAHIDMDLYQCTKDAIAFLKPIMVKGGIIIFDDYNWWNCPGVTKALQEEFDDITELNNYQAFVVF